MENYPELETERLYLNKVKPIDIPSIVKYAGNSKVVENTRTMPHPYFEEDAISWMHIANEGFKNKNQYIFAVRLKSSEECIGGIGLTLDTANNRAELGYWLAEEFWNLGYTSEAVKEILSFGFDGLQLNKIIAVYITTNEASGKVMIKNGMIKEGELVDHDIKKDHEIEDGEYVSLVQYRMLKREYDLNK